MLFFIDESWQTTPGGRYKVGVLSAAQIKSYDFNECSNYINDIKIRYLGFRARDNELKGNRLLSSFHFKLEAKGIKSDGLNLVRDVLEYSKSRGVHIFASVVFSEEESSLACADANKLDRPFFFLFERIDLFMKENYPGLMAQLIFDDRGVETNRNISKSVSNFFHRSRAGQSFDRIVKVPCFAISSENVGIQIADICAYILGRRFTGDRAKIEFFKKVQDLQYKSKTLVDVNGKKMPIRSIKVIKEKEAGDLFSPGRAK